MTPLRVLKAATAILERLGCRYCLIGGHAASLYRTQERLTRDVDFALTTDPLSNAQALAEKAVSELGLTPMIGFIPRMDEEPKRKSVCMVTSAPSEGAMKGVIDIILPELPWVTQAVSRAQYNRLDLGFAKVPVITPEDLIIAKCYALRNAPDRFQDLDDLKELFLAMKELDLDYLRGALADLNLSIPVPVREFAPKGIRG